MKKTALAASVLGLSVASAMAADMGSAPLKARVAAPVYSWTGCYAGGHLGYGWDRHDVTDSNFSFGPNGTAISGTNTLDSSSGIYGGQAGCNYQFGGGWVAGLQGDIAGLNLRGTVADPFDRLFDPSVTGTIGMKSDWIASATARLGITAWNNQALFYVKGGAAWDKSRWDFSQSAYCKAYGCPNPGLEDRRTGWTVGGGVEWVISPSWSNWTAFAEYNHYGFGNSGSSFLVGRAGLDPRNAISPAKQELQTVKLGLNYKLFGP